MKYSKSLWKRQQKNMKRKRNMISDEWTLQNFVATSVVPLTPSMKQLAYSEPILQGFCEPIKSEVLKYF